ncbi:MAG: hypothetical protein P8Y58_00050 [Novosphingobium sp.]
MAAIRRVAAAPEQTVEEGQENTLYIRGNFDQTRYGERLMAYCQALLS